MKHGEYTWPLSHPSRSILIQTLGYIYIIILDPDDDDDDDRAYVCNITPWLTPHFN